ncbi:MAG: DUF4157 domain-containing protein [Kofleriaceae bacterium]
MKVKAPTPRPAAPAPAPAPTAPKPAGPVVAPTWDTNAPKVNYLSLPACFPERGVSAASAPLPHLERVQPAFGHHDVGDVRTTVSNAPAALDANAYTLGERIAFARAPDVHLAAHEAAHVVQQRAGIVPTTEHEHHADRVADAVARGHSAEPLLDQIVPSAAPAPVIQFDRDEDADTDAALIAILERGVARGDDKGAAARVRDLTAFLLTLSVGKALELVVRINSNKRGDRLAQLFHHKLSRATRGRLVLMLAAQWGMRFGSLTPQAPTTPPPAPDEEPPLELPWRETMDVFQSSIEPFVIEGVPSVDEIERLLGRLERDELTLDPELLHLARLDPKLLQGTLDRPWLRLVVAARLDAFLQRYRFFADAIPVIQRGRAYLDEHSRELLQVTTQLTSGVFQTLATVSAPVAVVDGEVVLRRGDIDVHEMEKQIALDFVIQPLLGLAKLVPDLANAVKAYAGYLVGVPLGALSALRDLGHAAISNVVQAMKFMGSLVTGQFLKKIYELCKDIYKLIANLPALAKVLGAEFAKKWNSAGAFGKGKLVGEIVGYIALTIAIGVLSEGQSLRAVAGSRLNQLAINVLRVTEKAANPITYLKPFVKPLARAAKAVPGVEKTLVAGKRLIGGAAKATEPVRTFIRGAAAKVPRALSRFVGRGGKQVDDVAEETASKAARWDEQFWKERDAARGAMPSMAAIEAAPKVANPVATTIGREVHDLTPVMVDGEIWLRMCSKHCGPLIAKLEGVDVALAKVGASDAARGKVRGIAERTKALEDDWDKLDPTDAEKRLDELSDELEALGKSDPDIGKAIADGDLSALPSRKTAKRSPRESRSQFDGLNSNELPPHVKDYFGEGPTGDSMNIARAQRAGAARRPRHHVMPQEERAWFEARGFKDDYDIDEFCVELDLAEHQAQHGGGNWRRGREWQDEWNRSVMRGLRLAETAAGRMMTRDEIISWILTFMKRRKISPDFVPYG